MATKISALPLTGSVENTDYLPVVDAASTTTSRVFVSSLLRSRAALTGANFTGPLTASLGISASYYSAGGNDPSTIGLFRVPYVADASYTIIGTKSSASVDKSIIRCGLDSTKFGDTIGTTNVDGATVNIYNAGILQATFNGSTMTMSKPIIATGITASLGVTGSSIKGDYVYATDITASLGVTGSSIKGDYVYAGNGTYANLPTIGLFRAGSTPPTAGSTILCARYNNATDYPLISFDTSAAMVFGADYQTNGAHPTGYNFWAAAGSTIQFIISGTSRFNVSDTVARVTVPFTASIGVSASHYSVGPSADGLAGTGIHGSMRTFDYLTSSSTTSATPLQAFSFAGTADRTYAVNLVVTARSTTTTSSYYANWDAHYYLSGSSTMLLPQQSPTANKESLNTTTLGTRLTSSAGNIIMYVTGTTETYNWATACRIQEV